MNMQPVKSSNIAAVGYDADSKTMHVQFSNGTTYAYSDVPEDVHKGVMRSDSVGRAVNSLVKGQFQHTRLNPEEKQP